MEDPWANAWGETSKSTLPEPSPLSAGSSTWAAPSVSAIHGDNEDDLSASSWSAQPTTHWHEPDISETSLWNNDVSSASAWNPTPSTFDRISLSKDSASESETHFSTPLSEDIQHSLPSSPSPSFTRDKDPPSPSPHVKLPETPPHSPVPPSLSPESEDVDAFGTFETANEVTESADWSPSKPTFSLPSVDAVAWGASWDEPDSAATDKTNDTSIELDDAWERARQEKEKQDRHVPPELLASILQHFEELSGGLWPESGSSTATPHHAERPMDMEDLGLNAVALRLIPEDLTLPPNVSFSKTFTSKQLSEALRLTRHSPLTRLTPMAFYMSSKGLTSWEASIKAKPNITSDDFTPAGWKIVESAKADAQIADDVKKRPSGGGLLSFFGRRATTSSPDSPNSRRSASPVNVAATSSVKAVSSPRPSSDSSKTNSAQNQNAGQTPPTSPAASTFTSASPKINHKKAMSLSDNPVMPAVIGSDPIQREATPPQPSAVSRFLGRFSSRPRSLSSHDPLSLSADDLEFLSDVPTVETKEDNIMELDGLSAMLKSPPLLTPLPPPLKPPPKAPPRPSRAASTANNKLDLHDDLLSYLDHDPSQSVPPIPLMTAVPTPPVKSTSTHIFSIPSTSVQHFNEPAPILKVVDQSPQPTKGHSDESWPSFDYPSLQMNKTTQPKRQIVAIMASSPSSTSSTPPPLLPKPGSAFSIPPPPSSSNRTNSSTSHNAAFGGVISLLPPPPSSRSHTPLRLGLQDQAPLPQPAIIDDDDDFADFLSSPAQATNPSQLSFGDFAPPVAASTNIMSVNIARTLNNSRDEFHDFISPLPPQPPAKPLNLSAKPLTPLSRTSQDSSQLEQTTMPRKTPRAADHSRTLSLLETVATRGRWLAPPSPLPEALPPPSNGHSSEVDFLDSGSSMQAQQARAAATLAASSVSVTSNASSAWTFPPPINSSSFDSNLNTRSSVPATLNSKPQPPIQPTFMQSTPLSTGAKTGGLSAQDLSFFEGL
ncbi:hypothetical protein GALMADRAFT_135713 [Galerina marginata CBS 339.88]|uniref:Uncharacterized protein n=1 Tax=Galerina marginata (strain CBS 339.88) TaxID=685588 RepID=A0A067TBJ1_GALM3|nr:hypothetical protein GALMADRAFT_135713 [Galerina marginata CBS 339.88]